ncbi:MAG: DNA repair exonuclease [Alkalicoccus sp.]|nr:MAG: DNA repair exonuclease [Alkalicoccus sp.]
MAVFIHCADLHLDRGIQTPASISRDLENKLARAAYDAFSTICSEAVNRSVDFMIISGDLYHHEERSVHAQWFFKKQMEKLEKAGIHVYAVHGNHDPFTNEKAVRLPENVHIFPPEGDVLIHELPEEKVFLYGFSYPDKAYTASPMPMYKKREEEGLHIAVLHGQESSQEAHEPYAPFTVQELKNSGMDYWALGHIHEHQVLSRNPAVVYPGCIQGGHRKETGIKGACLVTMSREETDLHFLQSSEVVWTKAEVPIEKAETFNDLILQTGRLLPVTEKAVVLCSLEFQGRGNLHSWMHKNKQELHGLLREEFDQDELIVESVKLKTMQPLTESRSELAEDIQKITAELKEDSSELAEHLQSLLEHPSIRRHLNGFQQEELEDILNQAETNLLLAVQEEETK